VGDQPVRPLDQPLSLSASALAGVLDCPAKWFLEREAGGAHKTSQSQGFGNLVHALADRIGRGELPAGPDSVDELMGLVDEVWSQLTFRTPWSGSREREAIRLALSRFVAWQARPGARTLLATEAEMRAEVTLPDGRRVLLQGYADRLEVDDDGRVVVVDLKTGKYPPPDKDLSSNPQLGLYQLAVESGALEDRLPQAAPGGAELWQLRRDVRGVLKVQSQPALAPRAPDVGEREIETQLMSVATAIVEERFDARPGKHCDHCGFHALCPTKVAGTVLS
jgi:RecB family exonuclease